MADAAPLPSPKQLKHPIATWVSVGAFSMTLLGGAMVILGKFFADKSVETKLAVIEEKQQNLEWKVEVVRVGQENGNAQIQTMNANLARLLGRFDVEAAPAPAAVAAPPPPEPRTVK